MTTTSGPLWPKPIPIIGLTGEYASGKTLFAVTIAPGPSTLVYDLEKSSESYSDLGFHRVDAHEEMLKTHKAGYRPRDLWEWWKADILAIPPGNYRVIVLDPVSEIEAALADWVGSHPGQFGRTLAQYSRASGLLWGDVKAAWKQTLSDLAARCETFVFIAHMGQVYAGNTPTGKRKPKGKETLEELASLYLQLERRPDAKGSVPAIPSAIVRKQRLVHTVMTDYGEVLVSPALPPRLPVATPAAIRKYQLTPPDYAKLRPEELAPEEKVSEAELLELRARAAEAEAEAERTKLERERDRLKPASGQPAKPEPPVKEAAPQANKATQEQLEKLAQLRQAYFELAKPEDPRATWAAVLAKRGVTTARDLTEDQAAELVAGLEKKIEEARRAEIPF